MAWTKPINFLSFECYDELTEDECFCGIAFESDEVECDVKNYQKEEGDVYISTKAMKALAWAGDTFWDLHYSSVHKNVEFDSYFMIYS